MLCLESIGDRQETRADRAVVERENAGGDFLRQQIAAALRQLDLFLLGLACREPRPLGGKIEVAVLAFSAGRHLAKVPKTLPDKVIFRSALGENPFAVEFANRWLSDSQFVGQFILVRAPTNIRKFGSRLFFSSLFQSISHLENNNNPLYARKT